MTISEEWRHGQQKRNNEEQRDISRYKLLLENRAEKKNTQFRKESLSQKKPQKTPNENKTPPHTPNTKTKPERETREVKPKTSVLWLNV